MKQMVGVRMDPDLRAKLEELAARTGRTKSQVLRLLVEQARATAMPDVMLATRKKRETAEVSK